MPQRPLVLLVSILVAGSLLGCAVPVAPTGGPPDREPPQILTMTPENNAVNFDGASVHFEFNENVDEGSFAQALEITPEPSNDPEFKWSGKRVEIRFREPLEENTTYIFTIGTRFRDLRNVSLKAPITRAVSTGPEINEARLTGRVLNPVDGSGIPQMQIFAYAITDSIETGDLPDRPLYRTETDENGTFAFDYLSARAYFVLGVSDQNSNRRPDPLEVIAVPPALRVSADTADQEIESPWFASVFDTVRPVVRRITATAATRIALRYSENVYFDSSDSSTWTVTDSTGTVLGAAGLYQPHQDLRTIVVVTPLLRTGRYDLSPGEVADSVGNRASRRQLDFVFDARPDTATVRLESFIPISAANIVTLMPNQLAGVKFSIPVDSSVLAERLSVADTSGVELAHTVQSQNGVDFSIAVPAAAGGSPFVVSWNRGSDAEADSFATRSYRILTARDLGSVSGFVAESRDTAHVVIQALAAGNEIAGTTVAGPDSRFVLDGLVQGSYRLRLFRDDNRNARWDAGGISPYRAAEPVHWMPDSVRVRARWETEVDTVMIDAFTSVLP